MGRGSIQLQHVGACAAKGKDSRTCRCAPRVYAVHGGQWERIGELPEHWRKSDLVKFENRLAHMREAVEAGGRFRQPKQVRLSEYAEQWFEELHTTAEAGRVSKLTYNTYEGIWTNHLEAAFGAKIVGAIDQAAIRRYVESKLAAGLAPGTVNTTLTPLSAMLTDAVAAGLIATNPARQPRRARHGGSRRRALYAEAERKPPKYLEPMEAMALLEATPATYRSMVLTPLTTGFRRGEVLGLRWEDIDWGRRRINLRGQLQRREYVGCKCGSEREVVLYSGLALELGKRRRASGYVFRGPDGRPWSDSGPNEVFLRDAYERAKLRRRGVLWHALRHTYASVLAGAGIRRDVVEQLMGHTGKGTTSIYTHLFRDAFDGVEEALAAVFGLNETSMDEVTTVTSDAHQVTAAPLHNGEVVSGAAR
jgi:integrase